MDRLTPVDALDDVPERWRDTPIGRLLAWHELDAPLVPPDAPELLIGMCMDHRKTLRIPEGSAYVIRAGGANLRPSEFKVSYAIAVGGVRAIALIGHTDCGMVGLGRRRGAFVDGLVEVGWKREAAERHFDQFAPHFEIGDALDFVLAEAARLRLRYPGVIVAPLLYRVEDGRLYVLGDDRSDPIA